MRRSRTPRTPRFRTPRSSGRRWLLSWWNLWRVPTLVAAIWWFGIRPITYEQGWVWVDEVFSLCGEGERSRACVIDGDTLSVARSGSKPLRIRLIGFDTPELEGACEAESALARKAQAALFDWLSRGAFEWNGADDPPYDQYGRELREVRRKRADGSREYLAEAMINAGLASESGWGSEPVDWCRP